MSGGAPRASALPAGWAVVALGDILRSIQAGRSFICDSQPPGAEHVGVVKVSAVTWGTYDEAETKTCTDMSKVNPVFFVRPGDFLFSRANTVGLVGACVIVGATTRRVMLSDKILRFVFVDPSWQQWVLLALRSWHGRRQIESLATGNQESMRNIGQDRIRRIVIPTAPAAEQRRIVAEIEKQFTRLDEAVATLKAVQAKLKRARASVLKAAVDGRLVPTEAELARAEGRSYEPASALLERILAERRSRWPEGKKYQPPAEPKTDDLPELPEGWGWATLEAAAEVVGGITKNKRTERGREVPYLRVANVQRGRLDLSHVKSIVATEAVIAELRLVPGDILLNEGGDRDKLGRGWVWEGQLPECIHQNHVFRARVWLPSIRPKYVSHYANSLGRTYFLGEGKQTTNLASISLSKIKLLPLAVPPAAEQVRIVAEVERRLSVIDNLEHTVEQTLARCGRLRQSILKRAFEGKLVPQDPSDEPASRLLERLRAATDSTDRSSGKQASGSRRRPAASAGAGRRR